MLSVLAFGAFLLCAADYPDPPAQLQSYIKDGQLDLGDYGWLKGRFDDATPEEAETFRAIDDWTKQCREAALTELRARLRELGYAQPTLTMVYTGPLLCQQAMFYPELADYGSFAAFQQELAVARPVADAYLSAVATAADVAEGIAAPADQEFARQAVARRVTDQAVRSVLSGRLGPGAPRLTPAQAAIFRSRISLAVFTDDHANTEWLKGYVAAHGWPTISAAGEEGARTAWLLAQHADADPLFQLQALKLMEPLVAQGEVSKANYAFLYDRVMLKLAGKQRYGTQATCADGQFKPQPLEDKAKLDELRAQVGLEPEASYLSSMGENFGHC